MEVANPDLKHPTKRQPESSITATAPPSHPNDWSDLSV